MLNSGIIGFGKMGKIRADSVLESGKGSIVAVYDPNPGANKDKFPVVDSPDKIIRDPRIDVVFICTPNYLNKPLTIQSLQAGKNVFCEKPPAFTAADVREIMGVEAASGKKLMYGFNHRHHASVQIMKQSIDQNKYGRVLWMRGRYGKSVDASFFSTWRARKECAGGGILIDQGIHMLDLFLYLGGSFDEVHSVKSNLFWKGDIEDNVFAIFRNSETGAVASLHSTMTQWRHLFSLEIFLEKGYMVLNGLVTSSGTYGEEVLSIAKNRTAAPAATWQDEERIVYQTDKSWRSEIDYFFDAIVEDTPIRIGSTQDAYNVMCLIDEIYKQ